MREFTATHICEARSRPSLPFPSSYLRSRPPATPHAHQRDAFSSRPQMSAARFWSLRMDVGFDHWFAELDNQVAELKA